MYKLHIAELEALLQQRTRELDEKRDYAERMDALAEERAIKITQLTRELEEANQQLEVLRPGGLYAWKSKYEALLAKIQGLERVPGIQTGHSPAPLWVKWIDLQQAITNDKP